MCWRGWVHPISPTQQEKERVESCRMLLLTATSKTSHERCLLTPFFPAILTPHVNYLTWHNFFAEKSTYVYATTPVIARNIPAAFVGVTTSWNKHTPPANMTIVLT